MNANQAVDMTHGQPVDTTAFKDHVEWAEDWAAERSRIEELRHPKPADEVDSQES